MDTSGLKRLLEGEEETLQNAQEIVIEDETRQTSTPCLDEPDQISASSAESSEAEEEEDMRLPTPPPVTETPKKKPRMEQVVSTLLTFLMSLRPIRIDQSAAMYQKYRQIDHKGKTAKNVKEALFQILNYVGQISKLYPGTNFIQQYTKTDPANKLSTMSCSANLSKKLKSWLKEFETVGMANLPTPNQGRGDSQLSVSMLPSPQHQTSAMPTFSTTADGRTSPVGARPFARSNVASSSADMPGLSTIYKAKTSSLFGSMSWRDLKNRYSVKSAGVDGEFAVKLEIYDMKKVRGVPAQDWWKNAEVRAFVPVMNRSEILQTEIQLQEGLRKHLEEQPDAEGEYSQMR